MLLTGAKLNTANGKSTAGKLKPNFVNTTNVAKFSVIILGALLATGWAFAYQNGIMSNLELLGNSWVLILSGSLHVIASFALVTKMYTGKSELPAIV